MLIHLNVISDVVQRQYPNTTVNDIETGMKFWVRKASDRDKTLKNSENTKRSSPDLQNQQQESE